MNTPQPLLIAVDDNSPEYFDESFWPPMPIKSPEIDYTMDMIDTSTPIETVCIDIDQTIGDVSIASIFYKIWQHYNIGTKGPPYHTVGWFFESGGFRPYLKELMQYLYQLRETGKIKKILIHTSLSNDAGYVDWIVSCLEKYCCLDQLVDSIRDKHTALMHSECGATIKQLELTDILIDDKPWNAIPKTRALKVTPYYCAIDGHPYIEFFPEGQKKYVADIINYDRRLNAAESAATCSNDILDNDLDNIRIQLNTYFA